MTMLIGSDSRMFKLCDKYFTLKDILSIAAREIGTGFIGGKSVGMLLARKILEIEGGFSNYLEPHDSFYIGADVFYTYIVQNGWWKLRTRQKTQAGYYKYAAELREKLLEGSFPKDIREQFVLMRNTRPSPIMSRQARCLRITRQRLCRKLKRFFCVNQRHPRERYEAFEKGVGLYMLSHQRGCAKLRMNGDLLADATDGNFGSEVCGDRHANTFPPYRRGGKFG